MSDGDNAAPGRRQRGEPDDSTSGAEKSDKPVNDWITRSTRPALGAAPWERHPTSSASSEGNHTDGVTVADLIAKITGKAPAPQPEPEPEPEPESYDEAVLETGDPDEVVRDPDTTVIPVVPAHASELPDLTDLARDPAAPVRIDGDGSAPVPAPSHRGRHTAMVMGRVAAALIAVLALAMTGAAWQWQASKNHNLNKVAALDPDSRDIVDPGAQYGDENFLIVGTDSRIGTNSDMGAGTTDDAAGARSDTIMLVNIPANRKRVVAVSFPRDLSITPMQCEHWDPTTSTYGPATDPDSPVYGMDKVYTETKLNSAYAVGGPKCLVKVIQKLSGLSVNRFMAVDFAGFAKMVDALGGVEVCSTTPLEDYELGTVLANAGRQIVDGHTALQYVRARQVTTETNGDYGRIKRQQLFLSSLLRSLISKDTFFSLSKLNNVVNLFINDSYVDNIQTKDLVDLGQSVQGVNVGRITFVTVPTVGYADEYGNEVPRTDDMRSLFDAIINDDPLPEEKNVGPTPVPDKPEAAVPQPTDTNGELVDAVTTSPGDITVRVSNSTGEDGLASTAASDLEQHGFNVDTPDDYPGPLDDTTVFFSSGNEQAAATVASSFASPAIPPIERVSGMGNVIRVVLGSNFNAVNAPSPSGSSVQVHVVHDRSTEKSHLPEDLTVTNAADTTCE
ncbi:LytR family transcriptional regulator [Mycolicibacterium sp. P1-18]|uniref:LCP family protein n=1 Tax=Mycolicibacterium sp. P1-18 TaxID=2024615 RepID=UPI0011F18674|nr:LCP family protein [Mycolicibacterium sp. P1-18]KAA0096669.1 LytR family transcriptional regulator [Mycolicibacterium sp. P1-18]